MKEFCELALECGPNRPFDPARMTAAKRRMVARLQMREKLLFICLGYACLELRKLGIEPGAIRQATAAERAEAHDLARRLLEKACNGLAGRQSGGAWEAKP